MTDIPIDPASVATLFTKLRRATAPSTPSAMNYGFPIELSQAEAKLILGMYAAKLSERFAATLENEQSNAQGLDEGPSATLMGLSRADRQIILAGLRALSIQKE